MKLAMTTQVMVWRRGLPVAAALLAVIFVFFGGADVASADYCTGGSCTPYFGCLNDFVPGSTCGAQDVKVATMSVLEYVGGDSCAYVGDTTQVILQSTLVAGAGERYDVSMFVALDGGSAQLASRTANGLSCYHDYLSPVGSPASVSSGVGPYWNLEPPPGDQCGDIKQNENTLYNLNALTLPCVDTNNDGQVDPISTCLGWSNQTNIPACTGVADAFPNAKPKCNCESISVGELDIRKIVVDKVTIPGGYEQEFSFAITGPTPSAFSLADETTPYYAVNLTPGIYSVTETVPSNWTLSSNINETYCQQLGAGGLGPKVSPTGIDLTLNREWRCTFTNRPANGTLIIDKVTRPAGDPTAFDFSVTGGPTGFTVNQAFQLTDTAAPQSLTVTPTTPTGKYNITETGQTGWHPYAGTCDNGSPITAATVAPGGTTTCTITNTRLETITIEKITVVEAGGTAYCAGRTFGFSLTGFDPFSLQSNECPSGTGSLTFFVAPGSYTIAETDADIDQQPNGWSLEAITCTNVYGAAVSASTWQEADAAAKSVTGAIGPGDSITCVFENLPLSPLSVTLDSFTVRRTADGVALGWQTVSEADNAGFHLYRAGSAGGPWLQLGTGLIPAQGPGSAEGFAYEWVDTNSASGEGYWYVLEDVALDGTTTRHAPVYLEPAAPTAVSVASLAAVPNVSAWPALGGLIAVLSLAALGLFRRRG